MAYLAVIVVFTLIFCALSFLQITVWHITRTIPIAQTFFSSDTICVHASKKNLQNNQKLYLIWSVWYSSNRRNYLKLFNRTSFHNRSRNHSHNLSECIFYLCCNMDMFQNFPHNSYGCHSIHHKSVLKTILQSFTQREKYWFYPNFPINLARYLR